MYLDGILSTGYTSQALANSANKKQEEEESSLPLSWGKDTVSFSQEALAAQRAEAANKQEAEDKTAGDDTAAAFAEYMKKARGEDSETSADPVEQLEKLKERLQKLTEQKAQVATEEGSSEAAKQGKMEALDAEINQVITQIAELSAQIAKTGSAGSA